jgi:hypothetical protein
VSGGVVVEIGLLFAVRVVCLVGIVKCFVVIGMGFWRLIAIVWQAG